jgi:hypothetical protein
MVHPFVQRKVKMGLARPRKGWKRFLLQFCIGIKLEIFFQQFNFLIRISNYSHLEKERGEEHSARERQAEHGEGREIGRARWGERDKEGKSTVKGERPSTAGEDDRTVRMRERKKRGKRTVRMSEKRQKVGRKKKKSWKVGYLKDWMVELNSWKSEESFETQIEWTSSTLLER